MSTLYTLRTIDYHICNTPLQLYILANATYKFKLLAFPLNIFSLYLTVQQCTSCVPIGNVSEYNCVIHTAPTINLHCTVRIMLCKKNKEKIPLPTTL